MVCRMNETEKMKIIRKNVVPQAECVLNDLGPVFDKQVLGEAKAIRNQHNNIPLEEVLRPK